MHRVGQQVAEVTIYVAGDELGGPGFPWQQQQKQSPVEVAMELCALLLLMLLLNPRSLVALGAMTWPMHWVGQQVAAMF